MYVRAGWGWWLEKVNSTQESENWENRQNFSMGHDLNFNLLYKILPAFACVLSFALTRTLILIRTNRSVAQQTQLCRFSWNYNGIKKITVWKLVARNEDAFDRVRCLRSNKCHTNSSLSLSLSHLPTTQTPKEVAAAAQAHNHHILKRSSTRFNKLF